MAKYTIETDDRDYAKMLIDILDILEGLDDDDWFEAEHLDAIVNVLCDVHVHGIHYNVSDEIDRQWGRVRYHCLEVVKVIDDYFQYKEELVKKEQEPEKPEP